MATEVALNTTPSVQLEEMTTIFPYRAWQQREGIQRVEGYYVDDLATLPLQPWARKGDAASGTFINLEGTGGVNDLQLLEIAAGGATNPDRHMFESLVYVVAGNGSASVWYDEDNKQTFEWGPGSLFAIPLNAHYRFFNGSGLRPARLAMVTNAPTVMNLFHNDDFIFNNPFVFRDRFSSENGYFDGEGKLWKRARNKIWETNFVRDVRTIELHTWSERGANGRNVLFELAQNSTSAHVSEFPVGTYKKAHRHGPGAHVIILYGTGFSTLWREGDDAPIRCDWKPNSVVVPPNNWFHQHFNTGSQPASYLALKFQGRRYSQNEQSQNGVDKADVSVKLGGHQLEYDDEDHTVHETFEAELRDNAATCRMHGLVPWCTSDQAPATLGARGI
jgi:mannose-6-phosphate isomerase-like protein (cupin superfamily)